MMTDMRSGIVGYDSRYGSSLNHLLWITDDMTYCVCLFSDDAIVSRRVISSDEYRG